MHNSGGLHEQPLVLGQCRSLSNLPYRPPDDPHARLTLSNGILQVALVIDVSLNIKDQLEKNCSEILQMIFNELQQTV